MICNQNYFINSINELPDNFIKFHDIPSNITGCNVIDDIPSYLSVSNNCKRMYLVQPIEIDGEIMYNEIAMFYSTYNFTSSLIKLLKDYDNIHNYRLRLICNNKYDETNNIYMIDFIIELYINKQYLLSFYNSDIEQRIPSILFDIMNYFNKYRSTQENIQKITEIKPVQGMFNVELIKSYKIPLYNYQKNNIKWMIDNEIKIDNKELQFTTFEKKTSDMIIDIESINDFIICDRLTRKLKNKENMEQITYTCCGGLLGDEIGLGKTFSMIGLINERKSMISYPTLVICPKRLCLQWQDEINKLCDLQSFVITNITQYKKITHQNINHYDVYILPSNMFVNKNYAEYSNSHENYSLFHIKNYHWERVIIDEAHEYFINYKKNDRETINHIYNIKSKYRWLCTGSPELVSYNAIKMYTYLYNKDSVHFMNQFSLNYRHVLEQIYDNFYRKNTRESIKNEVIIQEPNINTEFLTQTLHEKIIYDSALGDKDKMIQLCNHIQVSEEHINILGNKPLTLSEIHQKMTDYYQKKILYLQKKIDNIKKILPPPGTNTADEYNLIEAKQEKENKLKEIQQKFTIFNSIEQRVKDADTCPICLNDFDDTIKSVTQCGHFVCGICLTRLFGNNNKSICPICRSDIYRKNVQTLKTNFVDNQTSNIEKWGTKMARLVEYINEKLQNDNNRIIIFSQWDSMLRMIEDILNELKIKYTNTNGSVCTIAKKIRNFKLDNTIRIILLSSEKAASGLNLTEANHIVLLDTLNTNKERARIIEDQAIGRSVRIGQTKPVNVQRFIMKDTIEHQFYNIMYNNT